METLFIALAVNTKNDAKSVLVREVKLIFARTILKQVMSELNSLVFGNFHLICSG